MYFNKHFNYFIYSIVLILSAIHLASSKECGEEMLIKCRYPLRVLASNQEFSFATNKNDLEALCPDINEGLRCIDNYTRNCMDPKKRGHFYRLYAGTSLVIQDICEEGAYQDEFLKHAGCLRAVKADHEVCEVTYQKKITEITTYPNGTTRKDLASDDVEKSLCCSFRQYLNCSENVVLQKCGKETAQFTSEFLYRMSSSLLEIHCDKYSPGSVACNDVLGGNSNNSASNVSVHSLSIFTLFFIIIALNNRNSS